MRVGAGGNNPQNQEYLQLTPLSKITDEDCDKLATISGTEITEDVRKMYTELREKLEQIIKKGSLLESTDYLRSKGYALPWMDLSVEDLVNYGWVKLKHSI